MSGVAFGQLITLAGSQYPSWINKPTKLRNMLDTRIFTMSRASAGKPMSKKVQGGTSIKARLLFDYVNTTRWVNPGETFKHTNQQTGTAWEVPWAKRFAEMAYLSEEVDLNENHSDDYRTMMIADVLDQKYQVLWSGIQEHIEASLWAPGDYGTMEATTTTNQAPRRMQPLTVFNNEHTNMLFPSYASANGGANTVQQINTVNQPKWRCQTGTYTFTPSATKALMPAMSNLIKKTRWDPLPMTPEYSDKRKTPQVIFTQRMGVVNYEYSLFDNQDIFRGMGSSSGQDPAYPGPTFQKIPVEWIDTLDTAAIYPTGSGGALSTYDDTAGTTNAGPRYHAYDFSVIHYVTHSMHTWTTSGPKELQGYIDTYGQHYTCWENMVCEDVRQQGTLHPSTADITNATAA